MVTQVSRPWCYRFPLLLALTATLTTPAWGGDSKADDDAPSEETNEAPKGEEEFAAHAKAFSDLKGKAGTLNKEDLDKLAKDVQKTRDSLRAPRGRTDRGPTAETTENQIAPEIPTEDPTALPKGDDELAEKLDGLLKDITAQQKRLDAVTRFGQTLEKVKNLGVAIGGAVKEGAEQVGVGIAKGATEPLKQVVDYAADLKQRGTTAQDGEKDIHRVVTTKSRDLLDAVRNYSEVERKAPTDSSRNIDYRFTAGGTYQGSEFQFTVRDSNDLLGQYGYHTVQPFSGGRGNAVTPIVLDGKNLTVNEVNQTWRELSVKAPDGSYQQFAGTASGSPKGGLGYYSAVSNNGAAVTVGQTPIFSNSLRFLSDNNETESFGRVPREAALSLPGGTPKLVNILSNDEVREPAVATPLKAFRNESGEVIGVEGTKISPAGAVYEFKREATAGGQNHFTVDIETADGTRRSDEVTGVNATPLGVTSITLKKGGFLTNTSDPSAQTPVLRSPPGFRQPAVLDLFQGIKPLERPQR